MPSLMGELHALAQGGATGDAGQWTKRDNEIVEILPTGERKVRFVPTSARETPAAIDLLCRNYEQACGSEAVPPLLIVATFVFDFLCIHPFRDGNGRVARLLTTLLLQSHGFQVARYISLERMVEASRDEYYRVLAECSRGWPEGNNEILPWWNYFLSLIRAAYRDFEMQVEFSPARPAKGDLVRHARCSRRWRSSHSPISRRQLVKKVLAELKKRRQVSLVGRGRSARWRVSG